MGSLTAVSDGNYHDGNSMSGLLTSFVSINKLYIQSVQEVIRDVYDDLASVCLKGVLGSKCRSLRFGDMVATV